MPGTVSSPLTLPETPDPTSCVMHRPRIEPSQLEEKKVNVMVLHDILLYSVIDVQPNCHQKGFIQQLMGIDTDPQPNIRPNSRNLAEEGEKGL